MSSWLLSSNTSGGSSKDCKAKGCKRGNGSKGQMPEQSRGAGVTMQLPLHIIDRWALDKEAPAQAASLQLPPAAEEGYYSYHFDTEPSRGQRHVPFMHLVPPCRPFPCTQLSTAQRPICPPALTPFVAAPCHRRLSLPPAANPLALPPALNLASWPPEPYLPQPAATALCLR